MSKMNVIKVTLSSKKVVLLRQMRIADSELAAQQVSSKSNGDSNVLQILMQKALLQQLLIQVDDKKVSAQDREDIDSLFTIAEYAQLLKVIAKVSGVDEMGKDPLIEMVNESK